MSSVLVAAGVDAGLPWHYGDPFAEQRLLESGRGAVDLSNRGVLRVSGPDRLGWLHSLTSAHLERLAPGVGTTAYVLDPNGHIEYVLSGVDDGESFWAFTEPGAAGPLVAWLDRMRFMMRVEVADVTAGYAVIWLAGDTGPGLVRTAADSLGGHERFVPRAELDDVLGDARAGTWAYDARRVAAGVPRIGVDTDARTIPNELAMPDGQTLGPAVHLAKGCYRGQETVARVHTLGRPPRRLVRLQLDGSAEALPEVGTRVLHEGRDVGFVGTSARHHEWGPIALALVKRNVPVAATLSVAGIAAAQEPLVDPDVGLHVRPLH